jgi:hypothetical protein
VDSIPQVLDAAFDELVGLNERELLGQAS